MCLLPLIVWYFQGLLTPFIAVVAVYIGWQQWKTNALKSKLDLFDRRFKVFEEARKILGRMYTVGVKDEELSQFVTETAEAEFLFGPEIRKYLDEIYRRVQNLKSAREQMRVSWEAPVEVRSKLAEAERNEVEWATAQTPALREQFKQYLDVSKL